MRERKLTLDALRKYLNFAIQMLIVPVGLRPVSGFLPILVKSLPLLPMH